MGSARVEGGRGGLELGVGSEKELAASLSASGPP